MWVTTRRGIDPYTNLRRLNQALDQALGWNGEEDRSTVTSAWTPACDVFEDKESIKIVAELPGVKADDVKLSLENGVLTIRGEKRQQAEEKTDRVHRYERTYGSFERTFALPGTVDPDKIDAAYADGVLTVVVPKAERARPREIAVKVGTANG